jgi:hypothetical protein
LEQTAPITEAEVTQAQETWGKGIVAIGKAFTNKEDYKTIAINHVETLYAFDKGQVLFKPTKASEQQFRLTKSDAISYFITGDIAEDTGFALQPWIKIRFENAGILLNGDCATVMGNYYLTDGNTNEEVKVEYTFGYFKDEDGKLWINLHHSSFPFKG